MRVAVIGAGHMGRYHAQKIAARADCSLAAVADVDRDRARMIAQAHGCPAVCDYKGIFGSADAAIIAVPTERHREVAGACLEAGVHVLVEKPIAADLREAEDLIRLAKRKGLVLHVGHVERYNAAFRALAARMERPLFIDAERLSDFKRRGAGIDVVLDVMIHDIDLALALAKGEVSEVSACGFRVLTRDIDIASARVEFSDGCVANLSASRVSQVPVRKLRVFQDALYVSADLQAGKLRYVKRAGGAIEAVEENHGGGDALAVQADAFVAAVRGAPGGVDGEGGGRALKLALQVSGLVRERLGRFA